MFPTVTQYNQTLYWYQRAIIDVPITGQPNTYLRTVDPNWTVTARVILTKGIMNMDEILTQINAIRNPVETWTVETDSIKTVNIATQTPTDPGITWGVFVQNPHVPPTGYLPFAWLSSVFVPPQTQTSDVPWGSFDLLGLSYPPSVKNPQLLQAPLNLSDPNTFGSTMGSNLDFIGPKIPLFDFQSFNYHEWVTTPYNTPQMNPPNLSGPDLVNVVLSDLGDASTISASSGTSYDVLTTVSMTGVAFGDSATKEVKDKEAEAIAFRHPRNITGFRVQLMDEKFQQLSLPRNYPVAMRLQLVFVS